MTAPDQLAETLKKALARWGRPHKTLKIGALVRISTRRIRIAMASAYPAAGDWGRAAIRLAVAVKARASPA